MHNKQRHLGRCSRIMATGESSVRVSTRSLSWKDQNYSMPKQSVTEGHSMAPVRPTFTVESLEAEKTSMLRASTATPLTALE